MESIAQTIVKQLGNQAIFMLGARDLIASEGALTFKIGRNAKSVSHLRIRLTPADTYCVEALRIRTKNYLPEVKVLASVDDVYVDALHRTIESLTGMYTKL